MTPQKDFIWRTHKGEQLKLQDMLTAHLYNSLQMVFNHVVPKKYKLEPFKKWSGIDRWKPNYRNNAIRYFLVELEKRKKRNHLGSLKRKELNGLEHMIKTLKELNLKRYKNFFKD